MPPSKKKCLRVKPPHHLHNPHTDPKSVIEQLFLLRRFDEALELSYSLLSDLCNREEDEDNVHKNKQPAQEPDEAAAPQEKILRLKHNCKDTEICGCSDIVVLVVQILYEMGKATLATPFACRFYRDVSCIPYDIVFVCMNLLVNSLADFVEAKRVLTTVLDKNKLNQQGLVKVPPCRRSVVYTPEQREILTEFLLFHVMVPLNETQEALRAVAEDKTLSLQKKEGWTTCLHEIETAKLLKIQEQQKQLTQNGNPPTPASLSTHARRDTQALAPAHKRTVATHLHSAVMTSRLVTGKLWTYLRNLIGRSRLGSIAFGIAFVYCAVHLFAALRRRNVPKRIAASNENRDNNTNNNNNNLQNNNTNITNRNNTQKTQKTNNTQITKPKGTKAPKSVQQYAGEGQVGGGVWSSMTKLMSDAVSLK